MNGLVPLLDALLAEGVEECIACEISKAIRSRRLFEVKGKAGDVPGWFMARVEVFVSPSNCHELRDVVATFSAGMPGRVVSVWRTVLVGGHQLMTMAEAAAECEAELRAGHPGAFAAYDAHQERQELAALVPPQPGGAVRRL